MVTTMRARALCPNFVLPWLHLGGVAPPPHPTPPHHPSHPPTTTTLTNTKIHVIFVNFCAHFYC
jgi:hypothetical protein